MITLAIDKNSPFLGEECPFCEHPFAPGDEVIICPECAGRHHIHCWRTNNGRCAVTDCSGADIPEETEEESNEEIREAEPDSTPPPAPAPPQREPRQQRPPTHYSCAQSCLVLAIALSILIFAVSCFGLWAIADYLMLEVWGWQYRDPLSSATAIPQLITAVSAQML